MIYSKVLLIRRQSCWLSPIPIQSGLQIQLGECMAASENMMSVGAQHALQDMVELEMYIVSEPQQAPWPMLPRSSKKPHQARKPYSNPVELSVAKELVEHGFI